MKLEGDWARSANPRAGNRDYGIFMGARTTPLRISPRIFVTDTSFNITCRLEKWKNINFRGILYSEKVTTWQIEIAKYTHHLFASIEYYQVTIFQHALKSTSTLPKVILKKVHL